MNNKNRNLIPVPTALQYAAGMHLDWECAAHEAAHAHAQTEGRAWTHDERTAWIDAYLAGTPWHVQNSVRTCSVCSDEIARCLLMGTNPFEKDEMVMAQLRKLGARITAQDSWRYKKTKTF